MKYFIFLLLLLLSLFVQAQIPQDFVAYYPLDNNANDLSPYAFNGTVYNVQPTDGALNFAYHFNGYSSKILTSSNNRNVTNVVTINAWVRATQNHYGFVVGKYDWQIDKGYHLAVWNNGHAFLAGRNTANSYTMVLSQSPVTDGKWHHLTGIIDGNTWQLYVDCHLQNTEYSTANIPDLTNNESLAIGYYPLGDNGNHRYFSGDIDEVYVYNRVLTYNEIHSFCTDGIGNIDETNFNHTSPQIKIYPNPFADYLVIFTEKKIKSISIFDVSGKNLLNKKINNYKLNLNVEQLTKGVYVAKVQIENGKTVIKKIIKE